MFTFEWVAVVYCSLWLLASVAVPVRRRVPVLAASGVALAAVLTVSALGSTVVRFWLAHLYLVTGYWLPALTLDRTESGRADRPTRFEGWLVRTDQMLRPWLPGIPPKAATVTELAYLFCYPLVPISFALIWLRGTIHDVDRFWVMVLSAGFACYVTLPWLLSRPPRALALSAAAPRGVSGVNVRVLDRVSHHWNTFPSGHVAVSCAAAWSVWHVWPEAGVAIGIFAAGVAIGAAAGRYHYVVDVLFGFLVAAVAAMVSR